MSVDLDSPGTAGRFRAPTSYPVGTASLAYGSLPPLSLTMLPDGNRISPVRTGPKTCGYMSRATPSSSR